MATSPNSTGNERAKSRKAAAARKRRADPQLNAAIRKREHAYYHTGKGKDVRKARHARWKAERPLELRARQLRAAHVVEITSQWLRDKWDEQEGKCALSGRALDLSFAVDHIIPKSRGGSDALTNLRLVCQAANQAKHSLLDDELIALCREILGVLCNG